MGLFSKILKPITNLIGEVLGFLTGVDFDDQQQAAGVLVNKQSNIEPIPVVYGRRKVGGVRAFISTGGGKKNEFLYIALVLSEGEIDAIEEIYINDTLHTDAKYSGLISVDTTRLGADDQTYSPLLSGADSTWGANHRLRGVAYLAIRLKYDQDVFGGIPDIQCVVRGRKVYDPRSELTAFSTNPALCLRDYLINERYGKGLSASLIDDAAFSSAANTLDTLVASYSGGGNQKLIECNAVIDTGKKLFDNVKILLQGMRGLMPYSNGIYSLLIDKDETSTFSLNPSNITSSIQVSSSGKDKKYNKVTVKYINPEANWQDDAAIYPEAGSAEETLFLAQDNGEELAREVTMNTVTNPYSAKDLARIICLASRENTLTTTITATSEALAIAVGDVVTLEHPSLGWDNGSEKSFRVVSMQLMDDGEVKLTLQEYTASIYPWVTGSEAIAASETSLPNPFEVAPPTNLSVTGSTYLQDDGKVVPALTVTWTAADDAFVDGYEVQWKQQSETEYQSAVTSQTLYQILILRENIVYDVRVRSINSLGARSAFVSATSTANGDVTAPAIPTALTASGGYKQNIISWVNPTDTDFKHVEVHASASVGGTYSLIGVSSGDEFVHPINGFGVTRYYKVRAFDFTGNSSGFTSVVSATTEFVDSDAFTDEVTQLFSNANVKQIEIYASLPVSGEYVGQVIFLTADNKLYRWTGSAWTASVPSVDITGTLTNAQIDSIDAAKLTSQIVGTQIQNGAISTAKIAAGAVSANEIAANAIIADKIASNAITSAKIAAGTIVASDIAASTITGDKITANTITGGLLATAGIITSTAQINDGLITNAKIGNAAITTAKIADLEVSTVKIAGNAITVPDFGQNGGTYNVTSAWQELVGLNVTVSNVGASSRILIFGAISLGGGTNTDAAYDLAIFSGGTLHTSLGFRYGGSGVAVPIIGSYLLSDNTTNNPNLRIRVLNGSSTGVSIEAKIIAMAAKR